jgi:hypothetical protein
MVRYLFSFHHQLLLFLSFPIQGEQGGTDGRLLAQWRAISANLLLLLKFRENSSQNLDDLALLALTRVPLY